MCVVKVVPDNPLEDDPPSDMRSHLGALLDSGDGSDVSFVVDGEEFRAHRAVLAARSPVFKAQLLGSMADGKMASITLHDLAPATFKLMLRFIYTDAFPEDGLLTWDAPTATEKLQDLLAVADRYALDRLKLMCARRLWDDVSADTVGAEVPVDSRRAQAQGEGRGIVTFNHMRTMRSIRDSSLVGHAQ